MGEHWQIVGDYGNDFHAGPKAQRDVTTILEAEGWRPFVVKRPTFGEELAGKTLARLAWAVECRRLRAKLPEHCTIFMQYPSAAWSKSRVLRVFNAKVKARKKFRLITLIHDLASLRWGDMPLAERQLSEEERTLMENSERVIVHNESMKAALVKRGIAEEKLVALDAFDYLTSKPLAVDRRLSPAVVIAGNLNPDKAGYLEALAQIRGVDWNLYGVQFDSKRLKGGNVRFLGCHSPEELPGKLVGSFGLVWDGPSTETCAGDLGNYMRINNPHKLSLYLASGLPVFVWNESAVADFVVRNKVGFAVRSLVELPKRIGRMTAEEYSEMAKNARQLGRSIRKGEFTKNAVAAAL